MQVLLAWCLNWSRAQRPFYVLVCSGLGALQATPLSPSPASSPRACSYVLFASGLPCPHIAAGANLSLPLVGR